MQVNQRQREADLAEYYDNEVHHRLSRALPPRRTAQRAAFADLLAREGRRSVLEIGCGPGRDGAAFVAGGLEYTGVDIAPASVAVCRAAGLTAEVASTLALPFVDGSFDAGWTMSTLLHVANDDLDAALAEIVRVLRPGAPLAVGLWGAEKPVEELWGGGCDFGPPRFFSIRTDEQLRLMLGRIGAIEEWITWPGDEEVMHYQWAVVRTANPRGSVVPLPRAPRP
ncbi:class I SAM-dependent methyltransferase [Pseudonocardia sp. TRM90224]|uniref:class I SAM-dependent methyltransferase n=1 Tax=Pseudonocardia sp. TRM90224 TaxID=2812678 RepID=UPI001E4F5D8C|nr:class I SAM-dependent methyltransferase [Pseudonocardia sp. TRM90224]